MRQWASGHSCAKGTPGARHTDFIVVYPLFDILHLFVVIMHLSLVPFTLPVLGRNVTLLFTPHHSLLTV